MSAFVPASLPFPVLVTGATGFIGGAVARRLAAAGVPVSGLGRNEATGTVLAAAGARFVRADLNDARSITEACAGHNLIIHCAARSEPWGREGDFYAANVTGTENVSAGAVAAGARLVHLSTPSLYFAYDARRHVRENAPLPARQVTAYARTKLLAETAVRRATDRGLVAITLRPRAVFGPGDTTLLPRLVERLARGRLPIVGDGRTLSDLSYIDNVVDAIMLAAVAPERAWGRAYNVTNGEPIRLWPFIAALARRLGHAPPRRRLPFRAAFAAAALMEAGYRLAAARREPPLTRYMVSVLALDGTLNIEAARRDLGYAPRVPMDEALARTVAWWQGKERWRGGALARWSE